MKYVRYIFAIIVVLYAAWIAFPVARNFLFPPSAAPTIGARSMDDSDYNGGFNAPADNPATAPGMDSIQGDTAVAAIETHNTPVIVLWSAVILLYLTAAWLHANGNLRSAAIYLLGFVADCILTYVTNGNSGGGIQDKILAILAGWDPRYVLTLVALVLGFLVYMSRRRLPKDVVDRFADVPDVMV